MIILQIRRYIYVTILIDLNQARNWSKLIKIKSECVSNLNKHHTSVLTASS